MKKFTHSDKTITQREIMIAIPSVMIGVGVLSMPKDLAADTKAGDGWLPIVGIGVLILFVIWFITRFVARFPGQQFIEYAALIVSKPVAVIMTLVWAGIFIPLTSIQIREIANMSKEYLLPETPIEIIALTFFLVVIYAVSGTRVGLFRLNMLFFPIITLIVLVVFVFNLNFFSISHLQPLFKTSFTGFIKGAGSSIRSYIGFGILWFYLAYVEEPKQTPKLAVIGTIISIVIYVLLFVFCIAVYGNSSTANLLYPTIELAKSVEIPGEFFERFESVFFVIWIMAIFNTTSLTFDVSVFALTSVFTNTSKLKVIFVLAPVVYFIAMLPQELPEISVFEMVMSYTVISYTILVMFVLTVMAKIREVKGNG
ncbi:MAG TPA: endospore germination permease [Bacillota bacterium]|nr:endospore germination permease [Bacillota bacterium]